MIRRDFLAAGALVMNPALVQPGPPAVPDVSLVDDQGRLVKLRALLADRTVAINFIFTGCVSFCPPQTAVFRATQQRLAELRGAIATPLLLSLSIDPLNDTPRSLAQYAARFDAKLGLAQGWLMLTGEPENMERAVRAFGASSRRIDDHPAQLWVGCASKSRWFSSAGMASADDVLRLMKAAGA
jgi:cytochrome oxidase Cu insertion factor (SCO1/SenC/PrrC family)